MITVAILLLVFLALLQIAMAFAARTAVRLIRQTASGLSLAQCLLSGGLLLVVLSGDVVRVTIDLHPRIAAASVLYDSVAALMLALVSFIGWVICKYSIRYLDGDPAQGRFYVWTSFTIGSVSLMVLAGNLLLFFLAWVMTSWGLHRLLLLYPERPAAQRAAWTKFAVSRLGDMALIGGAAIYYATFKTLDFSELITLVPSASPDTGLSLQIAGVLLAIGAITKSAQVPFHSWLPLTMETPTPVSALMHAGVVNAGGYLMIRTSPILVSSSGAMMLLIVIGGATACYAAVVMLTQTSVKKKLAYSTIAQMGFMLLQCGLGAFSAAMLHILAHSLYKAHAFLNSGGVMAQRNAMNGALVSQRVPSMRAIVLLASGLVAYLALVLWAFDLNALEKPGGLLLGALLCVALTYWLGQLATLSSTPLLVRGIVTAAALCLIYAASFSGIDHLVATSVPSVSSSILLHCLAFVIFAAFVGLFVLQNALALPKRPQWMNAWYVHASNGFYFDSVMRRVMS